MQIGVTGIYDHSELYALFLDFIRFIIPILFFLVIIGFGISFFIWLFPEISNGPTLPIKRVFRFGKYYRGLKENE